MNNADNSDSGIEGLKTYETRTRTRYGNQKENLDKTKYDKRKNHQKQLLNELHDEIVKRF